MNGITRNWLVSCAFALASLALLSSCDNFMSQDDNFKKALTEEVKVANSPKVQVRIIADPGTGTVSPSGETTVKVDVPFTILFAADKNYGFVSWAAYDSANLTTPLVDAVEFTSVTAASTNAEVSARLLVARPNVVIKPICVRRPYIISSNPMNGMSGVVRNFPIRVYFSEPMDEASFSFEGTGATAILRRDGVFKNLSIMGLFGSSETAEFAPYEQYYSDPVLSENGKSLTISPNPVNLPKQYSTVRVTVGKGAYAKGNETMVMADDSYFIFTYSNMTDNLPPALADVKGGRTAMLEFPTDPSNHRVKDPSVYLSIEASDESTGGGIVTGILVSEQLLYTASGMAASGTVAEWQDAEFDSSQNNPAIKLLSYNLRGTEDGVYQVLIRARDSNNNTTPVDASASYIVIRDTTPPDAPSNAQRILRTGATSEGWYNATPNNVIVFRPQAGIVDSAGTAGAYRMGSSTVEYRCIVGETVSPWSSSLADQSYSIPSSVGDTDSLALAVEFRDDLGNVSRAAVPPIKKDTGIPAVTNTAINGTVEIAGVGSMIGQTAVTLMIQGSDALSGVTKVFASASSSLPASPAWGAYGTSFPLTFASGNGIKTAYVWVKDAADNVSTSGSVSAILDDTPPSVDKFFIRAVNLYPAGVDPAGNEGDTPSYAKAQEAYFVFAVTEEGSGIATFEYDDGTGWKGPFACQGTSTSSGYTVTDANVSSPHTGYFLVTGKFQISPTAGVRDVKLRVTDKLGKVSSQRTNGKRFILDQASPSVSATFVPSTDLYESGGIAYSAQPSRTVTVTAQDLPVGIEAVSGIASISLDGVGIGVKAETENSAPFTIAGKTVVISAPNAEQSFSLTARDHSGNEGTGSIRAYWDTLPPALSLTLQSSGSTIIQRDPAGPLDAFAVTGPVSVNGVVTVTGLASEAAGAGINPSLAHALRFGRLPLGLSYSSANLVSIPSLSGLSLTNGIESGAYDIATAVSGKSGRYYAEVIAKDRVGNETCAAAGYWYDATKPVMGGMSVVTTSGSPLGIEIGPDRFVNATDFKVRLHVTDRSLADPEGTGLSKLTVASDRTSPYSGSCAEHAAADPMQRFIDFGSSAIGGSWNFGANQSITIIAKAEDGNGNARWFNDKDTTATSTFHVYKDMIAPSSGTVSVVYAKQFLDIAAGNVTYVTDVTSFGFTPTDAPTTSSGVRAWALSTTTAIPDTMGLPAYGADWTGYAGPWKRYTGGAVSDKDSFLTFLQSNPESPVYLHLVDNLGNEAASTTPVAAKVRFDSAKPVISSFTVRRTDLVSQGGLVPDAMDDLTDGSSLRTTASQVRVSLTVRDEGAGVKTIKVPGLTFTAIESPSGGATISGNTITMTSPALTRTDRTVVALATLVTPGSSPLTATVTDNLDFVETSPTVTILFDNTAPTVSADTLTSYYGAAGYRYVHDTVKETFTASGPEAYRYLIKRVDSTVESPTATASEVYSEGTDCPHSEGGVLVSILMTSMTNKLYVFVMDRSGNVSVAAKNGEGDLTKGSNSGYILDANDPVLEANSITINGISSGSISNRDLASFTFKVSETESGIKKIVISGISDITNTTVATEWTVSRDGDEAVITPIPGYTPFRFITSTSFEISGLTITDVQGERTFTVTVYDAVGNSATLTSGTFVLDTTPPSVQKFWIKKNAASTATSDDAFTTSATSTELNITYVESGVGVGSISLTGVSLIPSSLTIKNGGAALSSSEYSVSGSRISFTPPLRSAASGSISKTLTIEGYNLGTDGTKTVGLAVTQSGSSVPDGTFQGGADGDASASIAVDSTGPSAPTGVSISRIGNTFPNYYVSSGSKASFAFSDAGPALVQSYELVMSISAPASPTGDWVTDTDGSVTSSVLTGFSSSEARHLWVFLRDSFGNVSGPHCLTVPAGATDGVFLDDVNPGVPLTVTPAGSLLKDGFYYTTAANRTFTITGTDTGSGVKHFIYDSNGLSVDVINGGTVIVAAGSSNDITLYAVDKVGNVSDTALAIKVRQHTSPPTNPSVSNTFTYPYYHLAGTYYYTKESGITFTIASGDATVGLLGFKSSGSPVVDYLVASSGESSVDIPVSGGTSLTLVAVNALNVSSTSSITINAVTDTTAPAFASVSFAESTSPGNPKPFYWNGATLYRQASGALTTFTPSGASEVNVPGSSAGFLGYLVGNDALAPPTGTPGATVQFTTSTADNSGNKYIYAYDAVGNATTAIHITNVRDQTAPAFAAADVTFSDLPAGLYYKATNGTIYSKADPVSITITPSIPASAEKASGLYGFAASNNQYATAGSTVTVSVGFNLCAYDNVGNEGSAWINYQKDNDFPSLSISNLTGSFGTEITGVTIGDSSSGLDTITIIRSASSDLSSPSPLTYAGTTVSGLSALASGATDYVQFTITDKVGKRLTRTYSRKNNGPDYTLKAEGSDVTESRISPVQRIRLGVDERGAALRPSNGIDVLREALPTRVRDDSAETSISRDSRNDSADTRAWKVMAEAIPAVYRGSEKANVSERHEAALQRIRKESSIFDKPAKQERADRAPAIDKRPSVDEARSSPDNMQVTADEAHAAVENLVQPAAVQSSQPIAQGGQDSPRDGGRNNPTGQRSLYCLYMPKRGKDELLDEEADA